MHYWHIIRISLILGEFRWSEKGVATVTFPQGLGIFNFFLGYYRPIRGNWCRKTYVIIFSPDVPYFYHTIRKFITFDANAILQEHSLGLLTLSKLLNKECIGII